MFTILKKGIFPIYSKFAQSEVVLFNCTENCNVTSSDNCLRTTNDVELSNVEPKYFMFLRLDIILFEAFVLKRILVKSYEFVFLSFPCEVSNHIQLYFKYVREEGSIGTHSVPLSFVKTLLLCTFAVNHHTYCCN